MVIRVLDTQELELLQNALYLFELKEELTEQGLSTAEEYFKYFTIMRQKLINRLRVYLPESISSFIRVIKDGLYYKKILTTTI